MSVTRREAFLLFVMGFVGLAVFFFTFVITPLNQQIAANQLLKGQLENRKFVIDSTLPLAPALKNRQDNLLKDVDAVLDTIESPLNAAQFERWLLPLTTKYNMRIISSTLSDTIVAVPNSLVMAYNEPMYRLKQLIDDYNRVNRKLDTVASTNATLLKATYTYEIATSFIRFERLLDEISAWDTTFYVSSASYSFELGRAFLTLDLYTVHKILPDENPKEYLGDYNAGGTGTGNTGTGGGVKGDSDLYDPYQPWK